MSNLETYGLKPSDLQNAKDKLKKQKDFLESTSFLADEITGEVKTLLDYSYSANLSKRYYPRILNKVHTFVSLNESRGYTPIFMTITLDGFFRDTLRGDYSRLKDKIKEKYIKGKHIPNNDRMGYILDHMNKGNALTPKLLYKILGWQLHRFIRSGTLQGIRKDGLDYSMIRVTEPHKDGVPHFHILLYIPNQYVKSVFNEFTKFFPAPQNHKIISMRQDKRYPKIMFDDQYETKGFQTEIRSPAGYLLKYILKSFRNLVEDKELDYMQAWYVHNKIPRIITTHTLLSQAMYHHASLLDDDWLYLTNIKLEGCIERNIVLNSFHLYSDMDREIFYDNGHYKLINQGKTIKEFGENKMFKYKFTVERPYEIAPIHKKWEDFSIHRVNWQHWRLIPKKKYKYIIDDFIDIEIFDEGFIQKKMLSKSTNILYDPLDLKSVNKLTYLELYNYYINFDFDKHHPKKYLNIRNRLIEIGMLDEEILSLNHYDEWKEES